MEEDLFVGSAALLCEPSRAKILWQLLDGRAYTAGELAMASDLSPTSVSNHLSKLLAGAMVNVDVQGRHRYYSFASDEVAYAVEALANLSPQNPVSEVSKPLSKNKLRYCRTCYDHLAGKVGVLILDGLIEKKVLKLQDKTYIVTTLGSDFFQNLGVEVSGLQKQRRHFAKPCLDWSERKYHLAGALGAALLEKMLGLDWLRRTQHSRAISITSLGRSGLKKILDRNI